jgi:hypothetical protein
LAKKQQEFPSNDEIFEEYAAAETQMLLLKDTLLEMSQSTEVSTREAAGIKAIGLDAYLTEAYNRIYAEALPIARTGVAEDLEIFFDSILETLRDVEKLFNYARENNRPDVVQLSVETDDALNDFDASVQV